MLTSSAQQIKNCIRVKLGVRRRYLPEQMMWDKPKCTIIQKYQEESKDCSIENAQGGGDPLHKI